MTLKQSSPAPAVTRMGAGLGVEKACVLAAFDPEHIPEHLSLQALKVSAHYGLMPELARAVAELAFKPGKRR